ncbi:NgoMIV family type II restriction endonuclease [Glycomyces sp. NPDC047010]|uniref:NgoMIV family type II restriction endonuclease n=1 Tax=Glycomyces sp. NPDC047010 TaxID=3155023 RepID=UPI0033C7091C
MSAPAWFKDLLYYKASGNQATWKAIGLSVAPNIADISNAPSTRISNAVFESLNVTAGLNGRKEGGTGTGIGLPLEEGVKGHLRSRLLDPKDADWTWRVGAEPIDRFEQYSYLDDIRKLYAEQPNLRLLLGTDYQIQPDVTVGKRIGAAMLLHAVVSCKWTIRSDRVQNVRQEFKLLVGARRGRTPHLVAVTAEPLPSRLLSITQGTGEIDAVYHLAFQEMKEAVPAHGTSEQIAAWNEMTEQRRLKDFNDLVGDLTRG